MVRRRNRVGLHIRQHVGRQVHRDGDGAVAEPFPAQFLDECRLRASWRGGLSVPQIVQNESSEGLRFATSRFHSLVMEPGLKGLVQTAVGTKPL